MLKKIKEKVNKWLKYGAFQHRIEIIKRNKTLSETEN